MRVTKSIALGVAATFILASGIISAAAADRTHPTNHGATVTATAKGHGLAVRAVAGTGGTAVRAVANGHGLAVRAVAKKTRP